MGQIFRSLGASRLLVLFSGVLAVAGCDEASDSPSAPPVVPRTAEERFELIVSALRRQIDEVSSAGSAGASSYGAAPGTPVAIGTMRVESELKPPVEGEPRRAEIILITNSKVSIILPSSQAEEPTQDRAGAEVAEGLPQSLEGVSGLPDLETLRAPGAAPGSNDVKGGSLREITSEDARSVYELEYREGKWVALTEPDPADEPFYASAFEYALRKQ